jgi:ubiquinone biosynthesis protein COQ9
MSDADLTLDEMAAMLAPALPHHAAFDGWAPEAVAGAAMEVGIDAGQARLALPGGAAELIDAWFASIDRAMLATLPAERLATMRIRQRITALVETRLALLAPDREALRRALAILALPQNAATAARLGWRAADTMWRAAGDTAVDLNHYTKRLTLAGVYAATLFAFVADQDEDWTATRAFLARRIEGIMRFERVKAQFRRPSEQRFSPVRLLGRLRYPVR